MSFKRDENGHAYNACECSFCKIERLIDSRLYDFTIRKNTVNLKACSICGQVIHGNVVKHKKDKHAY